MLFTWDYSGIYNNYNFKKNSESDFNPGINCLIRLVLLRIIGDRYKLWVIKSKTIGMKEKIIKAKKTKNIFSILTIISSILSLSLLGYTSYNKYYELKELEIGQIFDEEVDNMMNERAYYSDDYDAEIQSFNSYEYMEIAKGKAGAIPRGFITYFIGGLLGAIIIPSIFFILYKGSNKKMKNLIEEEINGKIEEIKCHPIFSSEFELKLNSLNELEKSNVLAKDQFIERRNALIQHFYKEIIQEQRIAKRQELEIKLKTALDLGTISQIEFDNKMGYSRRNVK